MILTHSMHLLVTYDKSTALLGFIEKERGRVRIMTVKHKDGGYVLDCDVPESAVAQLKEYEVKK